MNVYVFVRAINHARCTVAGNFMFNIIILKVANSNYTD